MQSLTSPLDALGTTEGRARLVGLGTIAYRATAALATEGSTSSGSR